MPLELVLRAQRGDRVARAELLDAVDGLLWSLVRRYNGLDPEDLHQEAALGFLRALDLWKPSGGAPFAAFLVFWVRARCGYAVTMAAKRRAAEVVLERTDSDVGDEADAELVDLGDDGACAAAIIDGVTARELDRMLDTMKWPASHVIRARMRDVTLESIGKQLHVTREAIRQREPKMLATLRARARVDQVIGRG